MVKILAHRLTHRSAVATVLLITKMFIRKYFDKRIYIDKYSINNNNNVYKKRQQLQQKCKCSKEYYSALQV